MALLFAVLFSRKRGSIRGGGGGGCALEVAVTSAKAQHILATSHTSRRKLFLFIMGVLPGSK